MSFALLFACGHGVPSTPQSSTRPGLWEYLVSYDSGTLSVRATLHGPLSGRLAVDESARPFVTDVVVETARGPQSVDLRRAVWSTACESPCLVRYRFALENAARSLSNVEVAWAAGGVFFAPPSTWLLRPERATPETKYRFHVSTPHSDRFVTGVRPVVGESNEWFGGSAEDMGDSPFSAFGPLRVQRVSETPVTVGSAPGLSLEDIVLAGWVRAELSAVTAYFGRAPDDHLAVLIAPGTSEVTRGVTLGGGGAAVLIRIGTKVITETDLRDDWVLAHELIHVAMPNLGYGHPWFSEGLACYVEPLARVHAGLLDEKKMWADLVEGLPQGLPKEGDTGLDGTNEWGRVYWGGTLFFLLADLEIREKTSGSRSLRDALRHVAATGSTVEQWWPFEQMLSVADEGTGLTVLRDVYQRFGRAPGKVDLNDLWQRLGIEIDGKNVSFDDSAPLSSVRKALTSSGPS